MPSSRSPNGFSPIHTSKHQRAPGKGECNLGTFSTLKKRMRAVRRGVFEPQPPDFTALMRHRWFRNLFARATVENAYV